MDINEINKIILNTEERLSPEFVESVMGIYDDDSQADSPQYLSFYTVLHTRVQIEALTEFIPRFHAIDQKYIRSAVDEPKIDKQYLGWLYLKNVEYYEAMNNYADCMRYVNLVLNFEGLPVSFYLSALGTIATMATDPSMQKELEPFLTRYQSYLKDPAAFDERGPLIVYLNLIEAYLKLNLKDSYSFVRAGILEERNKVDIPLMLFNIDIFVLAGDMFLADEPISPYTVERLKRIFMDLPEENPPSILSFSEILIKIVDRLRMYLNSYEIAGMMLKYLKITDTLNDRISVYEYLIDDLKISSEEYPELYSDYVQALKAFHSETVSFNRQEFRNEIMFEELRKREVLERNRRENSLRYLSETDMLTGIRNRGSGETAVRELMLKDIHGMMCIMDADKFKSINDNYGHSVGDEVIKALARSVSTAFRERDIVFRLGGDEFAMYAPKITDKETGAVVLNRLFEIIDKISIPELKDRKITVSVGASIYETDETLDFDTLYKRADAGTYASKKVKGNSYTFI